MRESLRHGRVCREVAEVSADARRPTEATGNDLQNKSLRTPTKGNEADALRSVTAVKASRDADSSGRAGPRYPPARLARIASSTGSRFAL